MSSYTTKANKIMFHFPEIRTREKADRFAMALRALGFFSPMDITARYEETKALFQSAWHRYKTPKMQVPSKVFINAIRAYVFGFNEAAIHYSSLSVELMLLRSFLARKSRTKSVRLKQKKLTFSSLIREQLHRAEDIDSANKIRLMRNCYIHFQNQLMYSGLPEALGKLETLQGLSGREIRESREIRKSVMSLWSTMHKVFPFRKELINQECLRFMTERNELMNARAIREYREQRKEMGHSTEVLDAGLRILDFTRLDRDAFDTLEWSSQLLARPDHYGQV